MANPLSPALSPSDGERENGRQRCRDRKSVAVRGQFGFIASLQQTKLQFGCFGHHALVPGRIPDQFDGDIIDTFQRE